jgi:hypothetical protein
VNLFGAWHREFGFTAYPSPSGRRTAIIGWARRISRVGANLRRVQILAGHSALGNTQRNEEADTVSTRQVVDF